jgi:hypothetical protein
MSAAARRVDVGTGANQGQFTFVTRIPLAESRADYELGWSAASAQPAGWVLRGEQGGSVPMQLHKIGIDLGKTVCHLLGLNQRGEVVVHKKVAESLRGVS